MYSTTTGAAKEANWHPTFEWVEGWRKKNPVPEFLNFGSFYQKMMEKLKTNI